jgi:hypothetical protein
VRAHGRARPHDARELGRRVAADLVAQGAGELLDAIRDVQAPEPNP